MTEKSQAALEQFIKDAAAFQYRIDESQRLGKAANPRSMELQTEFSAFITAKTKELMALGISVSTVQDSLRKAMDRVPQTYAPDADPKHDGLDIEERLLEGDKIEFLVIFAAADKELILGFEEGTLSKEALLASLAPQIYPQPPWTEQPDKTPSLSSTLILKNSFGLLDLVLSNYKEDSAYDLISSGEIAAGPDGEALIPQSYTGTADSGARYDISEPLVYKESAEVREVCALIRRLDEKTFFKRFDIKKLLKAGAFPFDDDKEIKKEKTKIAQALWSEFQRLGAFYEKADREGKWVAILQIAE